MRDHRAALAIAILALQLAGCAAWKRFAYEGLDRDAWQKPDAVIALLGLREGDRVADLGAGGGYFTFRLAAAVGPTGRVYAVDVDDDMVAYLKDRARKEGAANVSVIRGEPDDPRLPDGGIDLLFVSDTYHHLRDRSAYFARELDDLAPNGRVAILELNDHSWFARSFGHMTPRQTIVDEMSAAGYRLVDDFDVVDRQSFLIFAPAD